METSGVVAKLLSVDRKTIYNWVDRYQEYFSAAAKDSSNTRYLFTQSDIIVLNTIKHLKPDHDWDEIKRLLEEGVRIEDISEAGINPGDIVISKDHAETMSQMIALARAIEEKDVRISELKEQLEKQQTAHRDEMEKIRLEHKSQIEELQREWRKEIASLNRMLGRLESDKDKPPEE